MKSSKISSINMQKVKSEIIGKYLSGLRKLNHVIAPKAGVETQLRAPRLPIPFGMRALGMPCEIRHSRLQGVREPCHVSGLQGLDNPTEDVHGTHGHLARGHGHRNEEMGYRGQTPFECRGG